MWLACFVTACWGAVTISLTQYSRYEANPTVVSLKRDYREWNGTIPAISFCYHQRIDEGRAQTLIKRLWNIEKYENEYPYFMDYTTAVVNITNTKLSLFNRFANDKRFDYTMMLFIVKEVIDKTLKL